MFKVQARMEASPSYVSGRELRHILSTMLRPVIITLITLMPD
ncbi:hypothetical protein [Methanocella conradii]|nr:hypothetical protein [Methanocella conradii]